MPAYKKNLLLQIGPIPTAVNLHTVKPSRNKSSSVRRICPEHLVPITQQNVCEEDDTHKIFAWGEWADAVETPEGWKLLKDTDRPPEDEPVDSMNLIPVPAQEIRDHTFDGDNLYYCEPSSDAYLLSWEILNRQMKAGKVAFLCRGSLRTNSKTKLWKYELFQGYPVLREVMFPEAIKPAPDTDRSTKIDKATQSLVSEFIKQSMSSWDNVDTTDDWQTRFNEWINTGEDVQVKVPDGDGTKVLQTQHEMIAGLQEAVRKHKDK
jgi:hypothetical protein